jgi:hypothetical protein
VPVLFATDVVLRSVAVPVLLATGQLWAACGAWALLLGAGVVLQPRRWREDGFVVMACDVEFVVLALLGLPAQQCSAAHRALELLSVALVLCGAFARLGVLLWRFFAVAVNDYHVASVARDDAGRELQVCVSCVCACVRMSVCVCARKCRACCVRVRVCSRMPVCERARTHTHSHTCTHAHTIRRASSVRGWWARMQACVQARCMPSARLRALALSLCD